MRTIAVVMSLAISSITLSSVLAPAFATKMNGKGNPSSDGSRSYRYALAMKRAAIPHTCSAYAAACIRDTRREPDGVQMCQAARAQCLRTGVHVGPYSGRQYAGMEMR
jgi:hypothetical protein